MSSQAQRKLEIACSFHRHRRLSKLLLNEQSQVITEFNEIVRNTEQIRWEWDPIRDDAGFEQLLTQSE